jgi:hypothetical protein
VPFKAPFIPVSLIETGTKSAGHSTTFPHPDCGGVSILKVRAMKQMQNNLLKITIPAATHDLENTGTIPETWAHFFVFKSHRT